jgi:G3E family GTPase
MAAAVRWLSNAVEFLGLGPREPMTIKVAGFVGAGKKTLCKRLGEKAGNWGVGPVEFDACDVEIWGEEEEEEGENKASACAGALLAALGHPRSFDGILLVLDATRLGKAEKLLFDIAAGVRMPLMVVSNKTDLVQGSALNDLYTGLGVDSPRDMQMTAFATCVAICRELDGEFVHGVDQFLRNAKDD